MPASDSVVLRQRRAVARPLSVTEQSPSLAEALALLDLFTAERRSFSLKGISDAMRRTKNWCSDVAAVLCAAGLLDHNPRTGAYTAGLRSLELAYAFERESDIYRVGKPLVEATRNQLKETTMLAVRWGDYRVNIAQALGTHPFRQEIPEGQRRPLYIGAGGKVLLAALSDHEIREYLARVPLRRVSPTTTTDQEALLDIVAGIRQTGYSETFSDGNGGGVGFAAAVRDAEENIIAALVVMIPLCRYGKDVSSRIRQVLSDAAQEICEHMSGGVVLE